MSDNQTAPRPDQGAPWPGYDVPPGYGPPPGYPVPPGYTVPPGYGPPPGSAAWQPAAPHQPGYGGYPGYGEAPVPGAMPYGTYFPSRSSQGRTLGIVGLMLSIIPSFTIGGLILSIIALVESRRAKVRNVPAVVGICVGALYLLIGIGVLVSSLTAPGNPVS